MHTTHHAHTNNISINIHGQTQPYTNAQTCITYTQMYHSLSFITHSTAITNAYKTFHRRCTQTHNASYCSRLVTNVSPQPFHRHNPAVCSVQLQDGLTALSNTVIITLHALEESQDAAFLNTNHTQL